MKIGRKLAIKILNASRFVLSFSDAKSDSLEIDKSLINNPLDLSMLASLDGLVDETTAAFNTFDYARALEKTESWFWDFTDNHLELVKVRAYGEESSNATSAQYALFLALQTLHMARNYGGPTVLLKGHILSKISIQVQMEIVILNICHLWATLYFL